jgi:hypothetical protein
MIQRILFRFTFDIVQEIVSVRVLGVALQQSSSAQQEVEKEL